MAAKVLHGKMERRERTDITSHARSPHNMVTACAMVQEKR